MKKYTAAYIALSGIGAQIIFGLVLLVIALKSNNFLNALILGIISLHILIGSALGIIPAVLLFFKKIIKFSAITSILFGIAGLMLRINLTDKISISFAFPGTGSIVGIFLIIAGITALWKNV